jgi:hypothetical protein
MIDLQKLGNGALAGALTGVLVGIGARVSMRLVALAAEMQPGFDLGATLGILLLFALMGMPFGVLFVGARPRWASYIVGWGALYGIGWAALVAIPFVSSRDGELSLASPWLGILLFAPLPFLGGLLMALLAPLLDRRLATGIPRRVQAGWVWAVAAAIGLAFMGMASLIGPGARVSRLVWDLYKIWGLTFADGQTLNGFMAAAFMLIYLGLLVALFFIHGQDGRARLVVLALLLFAAGFFTQRDLSTLLDGSERWAALASGVVKAAGVSGFLFVLYSFPQERIGRHPHRRRWVFFSVLALVWFTLPALDLHPARWIAEPVRLLGALGILGDGLWALLLRWRHAQRWERRQIRGPMIAFVVAILSFLMIWTLSLRLPALVLSGRDAPFVPLTTPLFLWPWLLPPLTILHAIMRRGLWKVIQCSDTADAHPISDDRPPALPAEEDGARVWSMGTLPDRRG